MTSREQFEAECRNGLINGGLAKHENGKYASELTDAVWRGWQASREAVEIELPSVTDAADWLVSVDVMESEHVISAIRTAGIKVKGE
ncbi:hypothetical protein [Hafnia alvei]|uniref:Uncharacterized protein n=1 Tax=Hafnia alvei ATCC 51873 TaxID=1002364 RepID=G9Y705_HAFAL|nr:hypothetical protein [Hafnia alvei]EHM42517.1 hypothetical protein HMPREF0454_02356 [Hafnia alvei ATCC 51873]QQE43734.1 hypothetical protein I6H95_23010 [Hafnia alvei]QQE43890.1 hypothetical protein I6H95_00810 [Hafnia alvei]